MSPMNHPHITFAYDTELAGTKIFERILRKSRFYSHHGPSIYKPGHSHSLGHQRFTAFSYHKSHPASSPTDGWRPYYKSRAVTSGTSWFTMPSLSSYVPNLSSHVPKGKTRLTYIYIYILYIYYTYGHVSYDSTAQGLYHPYKKGRDAPETLGQKTLPLRFNPPNNRGVCKHS